MPHVSDRHTEHARDPRRVIVLTGPSRAGKTTVCRAVLQEARSRSLSAEGVLTEDGTAADGSRLQFAADLAKDERRLLAAARGATADLAQPAGSASPAGAGSGPDTGPRGPAKPGPPSGVLANGWAFDEDGVAFGRAALETCLDEPCDLLVIDQLGPLELLEGSGWSVAFDLLARGRYALALVVVNPRVLERAVELIGDCEVHVVDAAGRDALPATLAAALPGAPETRD